MIWDLWQQREIGKAKLAASQAASSASRSEKDIAELEDVMESLVLTCQAMWELVREETDLTDEMLVRRMQEVDLRDGKRDGRIGAQASMCTGCSRPNSPRHERCVYCGKPLPPPRHVFA